MSGFYGVRVPAQRAFGPYRPSGEVSIFCEQILGQARLFLYKDHSVMLLTSRLYIITFHLHLPPTPGLWFGRTWFNHVCRTVTPKSMTANISVAVIFAALLPDTHEKISHTNTIQWAGKRYKCVRCWKMSVHNSPVGYIDERLNAYS